MRAVLKKASWCTRRVFRSSPCSKQASGVQKGYSVPETPFYGTELTLGVKKGSCVREACVPGKASCVPNEAEERGSGSEIGDFAKNGHLYAPVTAAKQLQTAVGCHQTTANHCKSPQTVMDSRKLPLNSCRQLWAAIKPLQIAADCHGLPQTTYNSAKLSQAAASYSQTTAEPPGPLPGSLKLRRSASANRRGKSMIIFVRTKI